MRADLFNIGQNIPKIKNLMFLIGLVELSWFLWYSLNPMHGVAGT